MFSVGGNVSFGPVLVAGLLLSLAACYSPVVREVPLFYRDLDELLSGDCRALAAAAAAGDVDGVERQVSKGTEVDCTGFAGVTPLYWAIAARRTSRVGLRALLEAGADPNRLVSDGFPLVHVAAMRAEPPWVLDIMLEHGGDPDVADLRGGTSPLFSATTHAAVVALVEAGADIDHVSRYNRRPLSSLAARGQYESVYYLLQRGADWQVEEFIGITRNIAPTWDTSSPEFPWYEMTVEFLRAQEVDI